MSLTYVGQESIKLRVEVRVQGRLEQRVENVKQALRKVADLFGVSHDITKNQSL